MEGNIHGDSSKSIDYFPICFPIEPYFEAHRYLSIIFHFRFSFCQNCQYKVASLLSLPLIVYVCIQVFGIFLMEVSENVTLFLHYILQMLNLKSCKQKMFLFAQLGAIIHLMATN